MMAKRLSATHLDAEHLSAIRLVLYLSMLLAFLLWAGLSAQPYNFTNFTNKDHVTDMAYVEPLLWVTTSGGIVEYNTASGSVRGYINTDGIQSNQIDFVTPAGDGDIYFGSNDGVLIRHNSSGFNTWQLQAREGTTLSLNAADTSGSFLWIASSVGVIKFDRFRFGGEVRETYRTLGSFQSESEVTSIAIYDNKIFAATNAGLAYADHQNQFLLDPNEWENIPFNSAGLNAENVTSLEVYAGQLFVGTDAGLYLMLEDNTFELQELQDAQGILDLYAAPHDLFIVAKAGNGAWIWSYTSGPLNIETSISIAATLKQVAWGETPFFGTDGYGAFQVDDDSANEIMVDGPASNDLVGGGLTSTGDLYAVSRFNDLSVRRNGSWQHTTLTSREKLCAMVANNDDLWVGTFGAGAFRIKPDGDVEQFSYNNSPLLGIAQDPTVAIVNSIYEDMQGHIWLSLFQASPFRPMVMFDPSDSAWTYWDATIGLISGNNQVIAAGANSAAIGIDDQGVGFLRYGSDPFNQSDDRFAYFGRLRRLPTNVVTALTYDRDDLLWVGTSQGLAYFDSDIELYFPQALPDGVSSLVSALAADSRNNLWVGTSSGLAVVPSSGGEPRAFTTQNSDLINDKIEALAYDDNSNQLVIFTPGGLSVLDLEVGGDNESAGIYGYPNPFQIRLGDNNRLSFNLDQRGEVRIFTVAGDLVNTTTVNAGWDGRNQSGELVASGVYIFHILAEDGSRYTNKVFVVRR